MADFFMLKKSDALLHETINKASFFDINPSNFASEREKSLSDENHNPFFVYPDTGFDFDLVKQELVSIDAPDCPLGSVISQKRDLFMDKCDLLNSRGTGRFADFSRKVYGIPSKEALDYASKLLSLPKGNEVSDVPSSKAAHIIKAELNHYGFDYDVMQKEIRSSAMVLISKRKILLRNDSLFSSRFVKRLIAHEIGTHVLRAENGLTQPFSIFCQGFPGYLPTEEGLAVFNEERFGLLSNDDLRDYAARALAVQMSLSTSFSGVYKFLLDYFSPEDAFRIATRVKRGLGDTSKHGGCTKDYIYVEGYLKVKDFISNGGSFDSLYHGKIGIEHLPILRETPGLSRPKYLPRNQSFKSLLSF